VIIGAGALGSLLAYLLHRSGAVVSLVEKDPAIVKAIRSGGLRVEGVSGPETVPVPVAPAVDVKAKPDLVLAVVKDHEAAGAAETIKPCLGPRTVVASIQNGIGIEQVLADALGAERVVAGTTNLSATLLAPGHVLHTSWGDTAVAAREDRVGEHLFGTDQQRPIRPVFQQPDGAVEIDHVPRAVFEADDARVVHRAADRLQFEGNLRQRRHIVEEQW